MKAVYQHNKYFPMFFVLPVCHCLHVSLRCIFIPRVCAPDQSWICPSLLLFFPRNSIVVLLKDPAYFEILPNVYKLSLFTSPCTSNDTFQILNSKPILCFSVYPLVTTLIQNQKLVWMFKLTYIPLPFFSCHLVFVYKLSCILQRVT